VTGADLRLNPADCHVTVETIWAILELAGALSEMCLVMSRDVNAIRSQKKEIERRSKQE
jgi:hypothetical protein